MKCIRTWVRSVVLASAMFVGISSNSPAAAAHPTDRVSIDASPIAMLSADVTNITVYGPSPHGVRVDVAFKGSLHGRIRGTMEGIDYSTIRPDGVTEVNVRAKITTEDQALISVEIAGTLINGQVSDTQVKFVTAAPQYAWLMDRIIVGKGTATTEKLAVRYFLVE